jgi:hypothetical protein
MTFPDPFRNDNPLWEPYELPTAEPEFGGIDNPAGGLHEFLREEERARAKSYREPQPQSAWPFRLGHIPGSPT